MVQIRVHYLSDSIQNYINSLDNRTRIACHEAVAALAIYGNELTMPLSKNIGNGLFELRVKEIANIRIIYTFYLNSAWILHVFEKTSNRMAICLKRKRMLLA